MFDYRGARDTFGTGVDAHPTIDSVARFSPDPLEPCLTSFAEIVLSTPPIWQHCLTRLEHELDDSEFNTWIMPLHAREGADSQRLELLAPNSYVRDRVSEQYLNRYIAQYCAPYSVTVTVGESGQAPAPRDSDNVEVTAADVAAASAPGPGASRGTGRLNNTFTFDNHVEGKSNSFARASSVQVGQNPGQGYNPLFIYGGVGLGKTHLMQAAGNMILQNNPKARVSYVHAEHFVSDMVSAIQSNQMQKFKKNYRSLDALLIDDIQFFSGKTSSQEEFFHTFNELTRRNKQIIITSDRFPKDIKGIEDRIISRLGSGLQVAIEPPELETRVAILNNKAETLDADLPRDVAFFVAENVRDNVRSLEGALQSIVAMSRFTHQPIDVDLAREALRHVLRHQEQQINIDNIISEVCEYCGIRRSDLMSKSRKKRIAQTRQIAMALCRELTNKSLPEIGEAFGRDHTTVLNACKRIKDKRGSDGKIAEDWNTLYRRLGG